MQIKIPPAIFQLVPFAPPFQFLSLWRSDRCRKLHVADRATTTREIYCRPQMALFLLLHTRPKTWDKAWLEGCFINTVFEHDFLCIDLANPVTNCFLLLQSSKRFHQCWDVGCTWSKVLKLKWSVSLITPSRHDMRYHASPAREATCKLRRLDWGYVKWMKNCLSRMSRPALRYVAVQTDLGSFYNHEGNTVA